MRLQVCLFSLLTLCFHISSFNLLIIYNSIDLNIQRHKYKNKKGLQI